MRHTRGRIVVVDSTSEFDQRVARGARRLAGWRLRGVDLRERSTVLAACDPRSATFVGCAFAPGDEARVVAAGALVLPAIAESPLDTHREALYSPDDLYDVASYDCTLDARTYAWLQTAHGPEAALAQVLHDRAVDAALTRWIDGRRLVGVMGGHAAARGETTYGDAARLGRLLGRDHTVATGGGPGAMEAANLGGALAHQPEEALAAAIERLAAVPSYRPSVDDWVAAARAARGVTGDPAPTLGVPTWHYGHEPPNLFATAIAKYVRNAQREAILLQICNAGIVFLAGAGGTVQEIFQDACENYYATETAVAPMVLVGRTYWTETLPAWPLLQSLARGRLMEPQVHLVDTVDEAAALFG